jgi:hypothetical protein
VCEITTSAHAAMHGNRFREFQKQNNNVHVIKHIDVMGFFSRQRSGRAKKSTWHRQLHRVSAEIRITEAAK